MTNKFNSIAIAFCLTLLASCGAPSSSNSRASADSTTEKSEVNETVSVKIIFTSGHADTIHVSHTGELKIEGEGLYDHYATSKNDSEIARHVDYFEILQK